MKSGLKTLHTSRRNIFPDPLGDRIRKRVPFHQGFRDIWPPIPTQTFVGTNRHRTCALQHDSSRQIRTSGNEKINPIFELLSKPHCPCLLQCKKKMAAFRDDMNEAILTLHRPFGDVAETATDAYPSSHVRSKKRGGIFWNRL